MKKWFVLSLIGLSLSALARELVIYGADNRVDTFQSSNHLFKKLADSTAARIPWRNMQENMNNVFISGESLRDALNVCPDARFAHQITAARCSGTLVAPDLVLTAGHCMMTPGDCSDFGWVFNYKVRNGRDPDVTVRTRDIYSCKKIVKFNMTKDHDFALVQLDRKVTNAVPVKVASSLPAIGTKLVTMGNPSGLPQKIADNAVVKSVSRTEFRANLDTFSEGSGSPVFNAVTGELLGVLVRGEEDYVKDKRRSCLVPNVLPDSSAGEHISSSVQFFREIRK